MTAAAALLCVAAATVPGGGPAAPASAAVSGQHSSAARSAGRQAGSVLFFEGYEQPLTSFIISGGQAPGPYYGSGASPSGAYWGRSLARAAAGLFSAWCAGAGAGSPATDPYGSNCTPYSPYFAGCFVPPGTNTTMTTGPFDLSAYASGTLSFDMWLSTLVSDPLTVQASLDGSAWYGFTYYGSTLSHFTSMQLSLTEWPTLGNLAGSPQVWFRFGYATGSAGYEGAYVDNVLLEGLQPSLIFSNGFEDGNTTAWSVTVGLS